jgi:hypothetical protein
MQRSFEKHVMETTSNASQVLRHPMVLVLASFVLTSILGVGFGHWIANQTKEAEQFRLETESKKNAVQDLSRLIYERRARADMLASSFLRGAQLDEIKERKKLYDEVLVRWNVNTHTNLFLIREVLKTDEYSSIERTVEITLVVKIFRPLDICLTKAYDAAVAGNPVSNIVQDCQVRDLLQSAQDCGYAVADELYKLAGGTTTAASATAEIARSCPR